MHRSRRIQSHQTAEESNPLDSTNVGRNSTFARSRCREDCSKAQDAASVSDLCSSETDIHTHTHTQIGRQTVTPQEFSAHRATDKHSIGTVGQSHGKVITAAYN